MFDLPTLEAVAELPASELPAVFARLGELQAEVVARLITADRHESPQDRGADDEELDVDEAARFIRRSKSWLRKHGRGLPGFRQPTGPGGRVRWARRALAAWRDGGAVY